MQVESTLAMQNLQPKIKAIQKRYAGNQVRHILFWLYLIRVSLVGSLFTFFFIVVLLRKEYNLRHHDYISKLGSIVWQVWNDRETSLPFQIN